MTFDLQRALQLARISGRAYAESSFASAATDTQVLVCQVPSVKCQVTPNTGAPDTIIAFRGTSDLRDAFTDAQIAMKAEPGGFVHAGVHAAVDSVFSPLSEILHAAHDAGANVWFTGHSLGGAEAMLAAYVMACGGHDVAGVITFESCRWCDAAMRDSYNAKLPNTWRVTRAFDPVPHLPLPGFFFPYRHVGQEAEILQDGALNLATGLLNTLGRDIQEFFAARALLRDNPFALPGDVLALHGIAGVIECLDRLTGN